MKISMTRIKEIKKRHKAYHMQGFLLVAYTTIIIGYIMVIFLLRVLLEKVGVSNKVVLGPVYASYAIWLFGAVLTAITSAFILRKILNPIRQLSDASKEVAKGNYDVNVKYDGFITELDSAISNFNKMAKEINSVEMMRNDFIANVSHEFKTPLSSVMGYVTLLQDSDLTENEKNEYIKKILFNIDKLNELTENILRLTKLENQNYAITKNTYRLDEQIREAIVILEPKWNKKNIEFDINMAEVTYDGPQSLLFQVWMNIISNAIKFSNNGGKISISLKDKKDCIRIFISDEGIGMSPETMNHVFDKFFQGDTSRKMEGNGLGLALCKEIIDNCGGKIYLSSKQGEGSTFMVELPLEEKV